MVEFGLKLQDNQVAEWSDHYIDYEELKKLLKKVKQALQRYEEQAKKKPELAKVIKTHFDNGVVTYVTGTPPMSSASLNNLAKEVSAESLSQQEPDERTNLLTEVAKKVSGRNSPSSHGGTSEIANSPGSGVHGVLRSAVSTVSGYFEKRYETSLRDTLAEISACEVEFDNRLIKEVCDRKVL